MPSPDVADHAIGKTRLLADRCSTCITRPLRERVAVPNARVAQVIGDARRSETYVVCHATLPEVAPVGVEPAVCRGFADAYDTQALRWIRRLWGFVEVPVPGLKSAPEPWGTTEAAALTPTTERP